MLASGTRLYVHFMPVSMTIDWLVTYQWSANAKSLYKPIPHASLHKRSTKKIVSFFSSPLFDLIWLFLFRLTSSSPGRSQLTPLRPVIIRYLVIYWFPWLLINLIISLSLAPTSPKALIMRPLSSRLIKTSSGSGIAQRVVGVAI